ncbi:hypothetical protein [Allocoleopsis sp.]|uniref:hypothetical protein n=1 Tax=Allocoleopsis sp. TaxID=3088169 RepID=UPI002FD48C5F
MKLKEPVAKAKRTLIEISERINLEGYMMPDGSYTLNATSLAKAIRSCEEMYRENRRLQEQVKTLSEEALIAWKKVATVYEQMKAGKRESLLVTNGNGW